MNEYDRKRQVQREDSSIKIIEAAISCFGKNGYAKTSIKDIAASAGVSHGLVGKYYESKENLLSEAYVYATTQSYPVPDGNPDLRQRIELLIRQTLDIVKKKPEYYSFFMMLISTSDLPLIFLRTRREHFQRAPIYPAVESWKKEHGITKGEAYDCFMLFLRTHYLIIDYYRQLSLLSDSETLSTNTMLSYIVRVIEEAIGKEQKSPDSD